jgi:hypothetical protein
MGGVSASQAIIAAMITPALLIMASGSLIASALMRMGRVVDRVRKLAEAGNPVSPEDLRRHERRAILAEQAMRLFFGAVVVFVLAGAAIGVDHLVGGGLAWLPIGLTILGMGLLVVGSASMLRECGLATRQITAEIAEIARR